MAEYLTLQRIVHSIMDQVKPHLTDDVVLSEEWYIDMINQSRTALINNLYISNSNFNGYYQEGDFNSKELFEIREVGKSYPIPFKFGIQELIIPKLVNTAGKKNIQYLGSLDYSTDMITNVSFKEFSTYQYHRFGNSLPIYTELGERIFIRNSKNQTKWKLRAIFAVPQEIKDYDYETSIYPIDPANLRQLEIITFQHIASKLNMPSDTFNNAVDETKNTQIKTQQEQTQEQ